MVQKTTCEKPGLHTSLIQEKQYPNLLLISLHLGKVTLLQTSDYE